MGTSSAEWTFEGGYERALIGALVVVPSGADWMRICVIAAAVPVRVPAGYAPERSAPCRAHIPDWLKL